MTRAIVAVDNGGVDGAVENGASMIGGLSGSLRKIQTGYVRSYALTMVAGAALVAAVLILGRLA